MSDAVVQIQDTEPDAPDHWDWNGLVDRLNQLLRLRTTPIGMKLFKTREEMIRCIKNHVRDAQAKIEAEKEAARTIGSVTATPMTPRASTRAATRKVPHPALRAGARVRSLTPGSKRTMEELIADDDMEEDDFQVVGSGERLLLSGASSQLSPESQEVLEMARALASSPKLSRR